MSVFRKSELGYMTGGRQLGRIATVGTDGTPHVVPVAFIYNAVRDTIDVGGYEPADSARWQKVPICSHFACRRRDSNPRHAESDSGTLWL